MFNRFLIFQRFSSTNPLSHTSIFSSSQSPWDRLFDKIDDTPPLLPRRRNNTQHRKPTQTTSPPSSSPSSSSSSRRQTMTTREINMFDEIFNMIFNAVAERKQSSPNDETSSVRRIPQFSGMGDILSKLRRRSRQTKWTSELDELLDRKKEAIDLCSTDHELLQWATREVFAECHRYEEAARQADTENGPSSPPPTSTLHLETYPHLLAHLMRTFRDKFHDPHLALAMFDHARHLSIHSYVFGCSTPAYNELIETRWSCFRDLKGVHDALQEMIVNGVEPDRRMRKLVELIRRHIGERNLWEDEHGFADGDVFSTLAKIEALATEDSSRDGQKNRSSQTRLWDTWKRPTMDDDGWKFDEWDRDLTRSSKDRDALEFQ